LQGNNLSGRDNPHPSYLKYQIKGSTTKWLWEEIYFFLRYSLNPIER